MLLTTISILFGSASAAAWFYASRAKVTREKALDRRRRVAEKSGKAVDLSGASFDGWDIRETLAVQSKWNSIGAIFGAIAVLAQAFSQAISLFKEFI